MKRLPKNDEIRFGHPNTRLIEKYNGKDDPCDHLMKWTKAWGKNQN